MPVLSFVLIYEYVSFLSIYDEPVRAIHIVPKAFKARLNVKRRVMERIIRTRDRGQSPETTRAVIAILCRLTERQHH